jgi:citrate lyase subunit beta/citryl-CoA lyase
MIEKASTLESDAVILDCEDSVPTSEKPKALVALAEGLRKFDWSAIEVGVRVNEIGTGQFREDVKVAVSSGAHFLVIPKVEKPAEVGMVQDLIEEFAGKKETSLPKIFVTIESPKGLNAVEEILKASGLVSAVEFGAEDYALNIGIYGAARSDIGTLYARSRVVAAAHAVSVDPLDQAFTDLDDFEGLKRSAAEAKNLGFTGKAVIHPNQIRVVNEVFSPTKEDIEWAKRLLEAWEIATREGRGAIRLDGRMVDVVHIKMARNLLEKARALGLPS